MLFNSYTFLIFFPIVTAVYFMSHGNSRKVWLLASSCFFYMALVPHYILILLGTVSIDYFTARAMIDQSPARRRLLLLASILGTTSVLFYFKYFNFFISNIDLILTHLRLPKLGWTHSFVLPLGLSFHTFQSLSYVIEVYSGRHKAEKSYFNYLLYVMFYPQLVAGPIERPQNLIPQLKIEHRFDYSRVVSGLRLMAFGFIKKVAIADRLAIVANDVFNAPTSFTGIYLIGGALAFAFQIYFDFSGYSDIAIGSARVMGFDIMKNFNRPYSAVSVTDFWRRWHISLSTWFRDYLYLPLGGNRVSTARTYLNILAVFLVSGLWHGANWTFLLWGSIHGALVIFERMMHANPITVPTILRRAFTFIIVTCAWVFFRANSVSDAMYILGHFFSNFGSSAVHLYSRSTDVMLAVVLISVVSILETKSRHSDFGNWLNNLPTLYRWAFYQASMLVLLLGGIYGRHEFIYFQF